MTLVPKVAFVLGSGRCGSTLVHEVLAQHCEVAWLSNVDDALGGRGLRTDRLTRHNASLLRHLPPSATTKGRLRFAPSEGWRLLEREVGPVMVSPSHDLTDREAMPWLVDRVRSSLGGRATRAGAPVFLHKLTGWPRAGLLTAAFPDARFVHVVRDGRAVVASWLQMPWWRGHLGPEGWHFGPLGDAERELWERTGRSQVALAALAWSRLLDAFDAAVDATGAGRWLEVRYEDLLAAPGEHLTSMASHLGLCRDASLDRAVARTPWRAAGRPWESSLRPSDVETVELVAERQLRRRAYLSPAPRLGDGQRIGHHDTGGDAVDR